MELHFESTAGRNQSWTVNQVVNIICVDEQKCKMSVVFFFLESNAIHMVRLVTEMFYFSSFTIHSNYVRTLCV